MKPWFERRPDLLAKEDREVGSAYPNLHLLVDEGAVRLRGGFPVQVGAVIVGRFQVEILLAANHPRGYPVVWETAGQVPRTAENHVSADGALCPFLPEEGPDYWPPGSNTIRFLTGPLNSYFVGFLHFRAFGSWPFGERRHGINGVLDFYAERTGISDADGLLGAVALLAQSGVKGHRECPCGSGRRIRSCHQGLLALRDTVSAAVAGTSLRRIVEAVTARGRTNPYDPEHSADGEQVAGLTRRTSEADGPS